MAKKEFGFKFVIEGTEEEIQKIGQLESRYQKVGIELNEVKKAIKEALTTDDVEDHSDSVTKLEARYGALVVQREKYKQEISEANKEIKEQIKLEKEASTEKKVEIKLEKEASTEKKVEKKQDTGRSEELKEEIRNVGQLETAYQQVKNEIKEVKKAIGDALKNGGVDEHGNDIKKLENRYAELREEEAKVKQETSKLNKEIRDQARAFEKAKYPTDSLIGLEQRYSELRKEIREASAEQRAFLKSSGKIDELNDLNKTIKEQSAEWGENYRNVGNYQEAIESALQGNGSLIGNLGAVSKNLFSTGNLLVAAGAAATAMAKGVYDATQEIKQYNQVAANLDLQGSDAFESVNRSVALSRTFGEQIGGVNELIISGNTIIKEFGVSGVEAYDAIENAISRGANTSGQLIDNLREYSSQIAGIGGTTTDLVNILVRAEQEGIYSDKGIDTVKEAGLRIREQTSAVKDALNGAFGEAYTQDFLGRINDGSTTVLEGIKEVSRGLKNSELTAEQTGTIIADVFGGPGEDAALRFIEILGDIESGYVEADIEAGSYLEKQLEILEANKNLAASQQLLTTLLGDLGINVSAIGAQLKGLAFNVLNNLIAQFKSLGTAISAVINLDLSEFKSANEILAETALKATQAQEEETEAIANSNKAKEIQAKLTAEQIKQQKELDKLKKERIKALEKERERIQDIAEANLLLAEGIEQASINDYNEAIKTLNEELNKTTDSDERRTLVGQIKQLKKELEIVKNLAEGIREPLESLKNIDLDFTPSELDISDSLKIKEQEELIKGFTEFRKKQEDEIFENRKEKADAEIAAEKNKAEKIRQIRDAIFDGIAGVLQTQLDEQRQELENRVQAQLTGIELVYQAEIQQAEGNAQRQAELQQELSRKRIEIEKKAASERKSIALKEAIIQGALAIIEALPNLFTVALAGIQTAAQIATIKAQSFDVGGFTDKQNKGQKEAKVVMLKNNPFYRENKEALKSAPLGDNKNVDGKGGRWAIIHSGEYIAPSKQVEQYPELFSKLDKERTEVKSFMLGGFTTNNQNISNQNIIENNNINKNINQDSSISNNIFSSQKEQSNSLVTNNNQSLSKEIKEVKSVYNTLFSDLQKEKIESRSIIQQRFIESVPLVVQPSLSSGNVTNNINFDSVYADLVKSNARFKEDLLQIMLTSGEERNRGADRLRISRQAKAV